MFRRLAAGIAALALSTTAGATVVTLVNITPDADGFRFNYEGTLNPSEGMVSGNRLVIFDFAGYVEGSIFSSMADYATSTELVSSDLVSPGFDDDPDLVNLIFTYQGPDFRTSGGPYDSLSMDGFSAVSRYGLKTRDAFTAGSVKNNPAGDEGSQVITLGSLEVPVVPEPATWAMMVSGFGIVGGMLRSRRRDPKGVLA